MPQTLNKNIVLIGLMGAGKSSVARYLAAKLNREAVSTDALIEKAEGRTIADIFSDKGEAYFRKLEKETVAKIAGRQGIIVDCGGGIVIDPENIKQLKKNGTLFYIAATPASLYQNIKTQTQRPLLKTDDPEAKLRQLLAERESFYKKADIVLETTGMTVPQIGEEIVKCLKGDSRSAN